MAFAKRRFLIAGPFGLMMIVPMYFVEDQLGRDHLTFWRTAPKPGPPHS